MDLETFRRMKELEEKVAELQKEVAGYRWAAGQINRAISIKGTNSTLHDSIYLRHRSEWASLWKSIDHLVEIYNKN